jgi:hypothetical protein
MNQKQKQLQLPTPQTMNQKQLQLPTPQTKCITSFTKHAKPVNEKFASPAKQRKCTIMSEMWIQMQLEALIKGISRN